MTRLLSVGFPLPHVDVDNYLALTAPSYFDYAWLLVDPEGITASAKELVDATRTFEAMDGRLVVNGSTSSTAVSAADQLRRRADETQRFLEAGGIVFVIARPNATYQGLMGFEGCDRYHWLPAPAGANWGPPLLRAAEGKTLRIVDEDHPLAKVMRESRSNLAYRAIFDDRQPILREQGRIIAEGGSGLPIAVEFPVLGGRVIFVPAIAEGYGSARADLAEHIVEAFKHLSAEGTATVRPYWAQTVVVPGIAPLEEELNFARATLNSAESSLNATKERYDELDRHRTLLWESGPALSNSVQLALRMLGFEVNGEREGQVLVSNEGTKVMLEVEGSREEVVEWPYIRLQRRLEERLLKQGETGIGGLIVVNGYRMKEPGEVGQQYTDALRIASENYRYTLMTTQTLFDLVARVLGGADEAELLGYRRRMLATSGVFEVAAPAEDETKPLF